MIRWLLALLLVLAVPALADGTLVQLKDFPSANVAPRNVTIWLPPGYDPTAKRLPVIYMHDGQNLFDPATAYGGKTWGVGEALTALAAAGKARPAIIVGVWNTPKRYEEYFPEKLAPLLTPDLQAKLKGAAKGLLLADAYLRFLVTELKPYIDAHYATLTGANDTSTMGSSMGGLISVYALAQYPQVFGQAAGLSVHWPLVAPADAAGAANNADAVASAFGKLFAASKWQPGVNRLYVDHGDQQLDSFYAPYAERIDSALAAQGWAPPAYVSRVWPGATHNEDSWRARIDVPLVFLLGAPR
jgi:hypothetical protein